MTKKRGEKTNGGDRGRRRQLTVICAAGVRQRFLRGMITHDLVQRGLSFDDAYRVAQAVRDHLAAREEVTTAEIRELIREELEGLPGVDLEPSLREPESSAPALQVLYHGQAQPFSRGLLARSIQAAGVDLDRAYRLVARLVAELAEEETREISSGEIAGRVGLLLEHREGAASAQRYRVIRRTRHLSRPLVIYFGGASGTGKSTLALELAPLLRVYRINATDTIRQVMRMVFTPSILPALHSSSFEAAPPYGQQGEEALAGDPRDSDFAQRLIATYEEQATRVCVGVRAVVERAVTENMSILVEGVHLHPGIVPFPDLDGDAYQVSLVLATLNEEVHRSRFLVRSRSSARLAERYLENFASIRMIHDHLLHHAEAHDRPILDTSGTDPPVGGALRVITAMLETRLPQAAAPGRPDAEPSAPTLLLIIDGLADRPVRALGGRTPLQAADTPTLDRLAREGQCGLADPIAPGVVPDTAAGTLALFGQSPMALKRGPVEALGAGFLLKSGDIALRGNFATLDASGCVIDRRAGRIREGTGKLTDALDRLSLPGGFSEEVEVRVKASTEHRVAIVLRGEGLSSAIQGSDPGDGASPGPPQTPAPLDPEDERAAYTASALALFEQAARAELAEHPVNLERAARGLPVANAVITRNPGRIHRLVPLEEAGMPLKLCCISGDRTILGLARWMGAKTVTGKWSTANLDTNLDEKFRRAERALVESDLVILHLKGADIAAHDRRPDLKADFLERVDSQIDDLLGRHRAPLRIAVASDHATLSESGQHAADPQPVLIWGDGIEPDEVERFDEQSVGSGRLQRFPLQLLLGNLFRLS